LTARRVLAALGAGVILAGCAGAGALLWRIQVPARLPLHAVNLRTYFGAGELARNRRFERFEALDALAAQLVALAVLLVYARRGAVLMRESAAGAIGTGMLLAMLAFAILWLAELPFQIVSLWWARRYHVAHQGYVGFVIDGFLRLAGQFVFVCVAVLIVMALARPLRRWWWVAAAPVFVALAFAQAFVSPYLLPRQSPLRDPALLHQAEAYARRDGLGHVNIEVEQVSQSTDQPNAESAGLGPSRRVILWDTLFQPGFTASERDAVVAHELGHLERGHILKDLGWYAILALPTTMLIALATRRRGGMHNPAAVPVAIFVLVLLQVISMPFRNIIHRRYEAEADWIALQTIHDPAAQRDLMESLTRASLEDPSPPTWDYVLLQDHPTLAQRIATANAWSSRNGP
jgi:STE24 endopeptidase